MMAMSLASSAICHPSINPIVDNAEINTSMQKKTATDRGIFLCSIHLQKGRSNVASMPPMERGIKKSLAKYKPPISKNNTNSFLITADAVIVLMFYKQLCDKGVCLE